MRLDVPAHIWARVYTAANFRRRAPALLGADLLTPTASGRVGARCVNPAALRRTPHPTQQPDEPLVVVGASGPLRELPYGEVGLLLAGTGFAEGYAPDPHRRRTVAGGV